MYSVKDIMAMLLDARVTELELNDQDVEAASDLAMPLGKLPHSKKMEHI